MHSLKGKLAVIIGGTSGIGLAVAKNFADNGATVVVTGRRADGGTVAAENGIKFLRCDAADEGQVSRALSEIEETAGKIELLVINAGVADDEGSMEEYGFDQMQRLIDVNLNGVFLALKYGPRHMKDGGSIITTGSVAGRGWTSGGSGVYAASKAGAAYLTRTSAIELASRGIRANTVCPAVIAGTGMMVEDDGGPEARFFSTLTAFGRMGRMDEVVGAYNFLASSASTFITGQEICIDGGLTAGLGRPMQEAAGGWEDKTP